MIIPPIRLQDAHGAGYYGAPRGARTHNGIDLCCHKDSLVMSVTPGKVTRIGYPYDPGDDDKGHLLYVQVTDAAGRDHRYFYVSPMVNVGEIISRGAVIGVAQGLLEVYPGITDHIHYEIKVDGDYVDPSEFYRGVSL